MNKEEIILTREELNGLLKEHKNLKADYIRSKEYLRRALLKLKESINYFDIEADGSDDFEDKITKFIGEVKRKCQL